MGFQGSVVEAQTLLDVSGAVPESVTVGILQACRSRVFADIQAAITTAIADGWGVRPPPSICRFLLSVVMCIIRKLLDGDNVERDMPSKGATCIVAA